MSEVALPSDTAPTRTTHAGQIEQSRAIAEVQAAVVAAKQVPRDIGAAEADMRDACGRLGLANRAFYSVQSRGTGPTVHLARVLAGLYGNIQYGVAELHRDDHAGYSEVQAFAWDVEKNVRSTRTFQVPHARMKGGSRQPLTDITDVYLNNQNVGARAVRECIFSVLPAWFTDTAQELCHETLTNGAGRSLPDRVADMVRGFSELGVSAEQIEQRLGRPRSAWRPIDIGNMQIVYMSIKHGEVDRDEAFPTRRVTAAEVFSEDQDTPPKTAPAVTRGSGDPVPTGSTARQEPTPETSGGDTGPSEGLSPDPADRDSGTVDSGHADHGVGRPNGKRATNTQSSALMNHWARLGMMPDQPGRILAMNRLLGYPDDTITAASELRGPEAAKLLALLEPVTDRHQLDSVLAGQDQIL